MMYAKRILIPILLIGVCAEQELVDLISSVFNEALTFARIPQKPAVGRRSYSPTGCGYSNIKEVDFEIEGARNNEAEFGEFPWMVAILRKEDDVYEFGGSLITPQVVLTSAQYVQAKPASYFKVLAGEWETDTKTELHAGQYRQVVEMIVHEDFNSQTMSNNIALFFLDAPFDLTSNVNTVCVPPATQNFDLYRCKGHFQNGQPGVLKKIDLSVLPNAKCQENLKNSSLGKDFVLHSSFMCAGGERGKDTCKGDAGSPLVCPMSNNSDRYFQAGIVAWGIGCGEENIPDVYTSVSKLRPWIDEQLVFKSIVSA